MERHRHREKKKDKLSKKEQDRQAIIKFVAGLVLMFALVSYGAGLFALGLPFLVGISILPNKGTLKDKWNKMGKKQKGVFVLVAILITPFIIVGLLWTMLLASMILIDMLVFVPIFLIVAWFLFKNPKYQKNAVTKFLGSYYSLAIGVILLMVIIGLASYNYYTYEKSHEYKNLNWSTQMKSLQQPDSHGYVHVSEPVILPNGTPEYNFRINPSRTHDVIFLITDVITPAWLNNIETSNIADYLSYNRSFKSTNMTNESSIENNTDYVNHTLTVSKTYEKLEIKGNGMPIANARVVLVGKAKPNNQLGIPAGQLTELPQQYGLLTSDDGLVEFKNVSEGVYEIKIYANGYYPITKTFVVCNETLNGTYVTYHMIPIYFHVDVNWILQPKVKTGDWTDGYDAVTFAETMNKSKIVLMQSLVPTGDEVKKAFGLNDSDTQMFWSQLRRENSMYGWLGVGTPNNPINDLSMHLMFTQQVLYTNSIYATTHDINPPHWGWQTWAGIGLIVAGVVVTVASFGTASPVGFAMLGIGGGMVIAGGTSLIYQYASQRQYHVKVDYIVMDIKVTTGHPPQEEPIIWSNTNGKVAGYNYNELAINYTPDQLKSHQLGGNPDIYGFDFYVFGKGYPMTDTINVQVTMWVAFHYIDQDGNPVVYQGQQEVVYESSNQVGLYLPQTHIR